MVQAVIDFDLFDSLALALLPSVDSSLAAVLSVAAVVEPLAVEPAELVRFAEPVAAAVAE